MRVKAETYVIETKCTIKKIGENESTFEMIKWRLSAIIQVFDFTEKVLHHIRFA